MRFMTGSARVPFRIPSQQKGFLMNTYRKPLAFAFAVIAGVLLLTSAAFACTTFRGRFTVTAIAPGSGSVTAVGSNSGMNYCVAPTGTASLERDPQTKGGSFTATVAPDNTCGASKLTAGLYTVTYRYGPSVNNNNEYFATINDCMNPLPTKTLGPMVVDADGKGSGTYELIGPNPPGDAQICVSDANGGQGNQVPVKLI